MGLLPIPASLDVTSERWFPEAPLMGGVRFSSAFLDGGAHELSSELETFALCLGRARTWKAHDT